MIKNVIKQSTKIQGVLILIAILVNLSFIEYRLKDYVLSARTTRIYTEGSQRYLLAKVSLTNNTSDTLKYLSWTCSYQMFYLVKSKTLTIAGYTCLKNLPSVKTLPPHMRDSVTLKFKVNVRKAMPVKFKVGMMLAEDKGDNFLNELLHKPMKSIIIWADEVTSTN